MDRRTRTRRGVGADRRRPLAPPSRSREPDHDVLFFGTLRYPPNIDALERLGHLWDPLTAMRPGTTALVAGSAPTARVEDLCRVHGWTLLPNFASLPAVRRHASHALPSLRSLAPQACRSRCWTRRASDFPRWSRPRRWKATNRVSRCFPRRPTMDSPVRSFASSMMRTQHPCRSQTPTASPGHATASKVGSRGQRSLLKGTAQSPT